MKQIEYNNCGSIGISSISYTKLTITLLEIISLNGCDGNWFCSYDGAYIQKRQFLFQWGRGAGRLWPFDPDVPFRENLHGSESQGGHTLWRQYKEAGMSLSSEKNCEAASCQGFLSFLYFLFPVALYWQQMDYSLIQFLDILSHMLSLFLFLSPSSPFQYFFFPSNSSGFPFSSHAFFHLNISFSL